jgi:hypothetical protein
MPDTSVDVALISQFEAEVHDAYQRQGSLLRNLVRRSTQMPGKDVSFPIIGKGAAKRGRTRAGELQPMNVAHSGVKVTLIESNAPIYIDKFDQLRTNVDLRRGYVNASSGAIGRDSDQHIIDVLDGATGGGAVSKNLSALAVADLTGLVTRLGAKDVPVSADRVAVAVSWGVWGKLLTIQEFVNSQWVGPDAMPLKTPNIQGKIWAGATCKCYAWDRESVGHGIGEDANTTVDWVATKKSYLANTSMTQGAVLIDDLGVERITINEAA